MLFIDGKDLEKLLELWNSAHRVFIPKKVYGETMLMPYERGTLDLNYTNFSQPVKEFLFKSKEVLFKWNITGDNSVELSAGGKEEKTVVLFGIRACDANGIAYTDRFFLGEYCDDVYKRNRDHIIVAALNCTEVGENCFCGSLGSEAGPLANKGCDLIFTPAGSGYLIEAKTSKGESLISYGRELIRHSSLDEKEIRLKLYEKLEKKFIKRIGKSDIKETLKKNFDDEVWDRIAEKCLRCGGCTNVCPTCTCFNVVEENKDNNEGTRVRYWDSCQSDSFTRNAGDHSPRNKASRVRYRIYDKLKYIEERFGFKGCTGCGRCIKACPVNLDIVNIINELPEGENKLESIKDPCEESKEIQHEHKNCEKVYLPKVAVIKDITQETRNIKRFTLEYEDNELHKNLELEGQFFEITVFGVGEIAISIPFSPNRRESFDFCVKKVGKVTEALHDMKVGDKVGLRGPFGKGFPYEDMKGRDVLIVGSGVGIAPVRTIIERITEEREKFGKVVVIGSAISYEDLIYKEDFVRWERDSGIKIYYALSKPTDKVNAHVGYINDLLPQIENDWGKSVAILCASPRRIKEVAGDLLRLGMDGKNILTSLETHMRCGIGKCGHCKVGNKYMCVDGPVFNYEEMLELPPEF